MAKHKYKCQYCDKFFDSMQALGGHLITHKRDRQPLKNITINLPEIYVKAIEILVKKRIYPSRSEIVRIALRDFLRKEFKFKREIAIEEFTLLTMRRCI